MDGYTGEIVIKDAKKLESVKKLRINRHLLRDWLALGIEIQFVCYEEDRGSYGSCRGWVER